jgi:hypothetical protein
MRNKLLLLFLLLTGCSSSRFVLDTRETTFRQLLDHIEDQQQKITSLQAVSRITIESREFNGNFFARILYRQSDSLLITVTGFFGMEAGNLFIGRDRFIFYNQMSNKFYNGSVQDFKFRRFMQFPLPLPELSNLFLARETFTIMKIIRYTEDENLFFIEAQNGDYNYKIWIDPDTGRILKLHSYRFDQLLYTREYGDFIRINGLYFPRKIIMTQPEARQAVAVYYTELKLNQEITRDKFEIKISDKAEQIDLSLIRTNDEQE